ncbi:MAG TPA: helix-turn-helix domain-containing protein [Gammaproteobacteria bacterium]|nr:helix-turn-helix domain-containing protein [Gammaproteobacteria bacterium]
MNDSIPIEAQQSLTSWGEAISIARRRRRWSQENLALRMNTSLSTIRRMEEGNPGIGIGIWCSALWLLGMLDRVDTAISPEQDLIGIGADLNELPKRVRDNDDF